MLHPITIKNEKYMQEFDIEYIPALDRTVIFRNTLTPDHEDIIAIECIGWYQGEPDDNANRYWINLPSQIAWL